MLLDELAKLCLIASVEEGIDLVDDQGPNPTQKQLLAISPILQFVKSGDQAVHPRPQFVCLNLVALPRVNTMKLHRYLIVKWLESII